MSQVIAHDALARLKRVGWRSTTTLGFLVQRGTGSTLGFMNPGGTATKELAVAIPSAAYLSWQVPRDVKPGTTAYFHIHWTTDGTSTDPVRWYFNFRHSAPGEVIPSTTNLDEEVAPSGTAWEHMVTEMPTGFVVPAAGTHVATQFRRMTPSSGTNPDTVFCLSIDIVYESSLDDATWDRA